MPDAFDPSVRHAPTMLTTDLSLRIDSTYEKITRRWLDHPEEFAVEFAKAWYKLTHRDMGPVDRYLGALVPQEVLLWQDPIPAVTHDLIGAEDVATLKGQILSSGLTVPQLISTAWAAASSFRGSDMCGGANGSRVDLLFGSNSELRALSEVYAADDANAKFVQDFVSAWDKVMNLDRFDLP